MCEREEAKTGERTCIDEWKSSAALCSYCAKAYFLDSSGPVEMVGVVMLTFPTGGAPCWSLLDMSFGRTS